MTSAESPSHQRTYQRLSEMILFGDFVPGNSITIQGAADQLNVSITPVREALRRLISQGALDLQENRRISIPFMTKKRLQDLIDVRLFLEPRATARAIDQIGSNEIAEMAAIDNKIDRAIETGDTPLYMRENFNFHFYLYTRSEFTTALPLIHSVWLQVGPHMRVICGREGILQLKDQHKSILNALRENDAAKLKTAMKADIEQGSEILFSTINE